MKKALLTLANVSLLLGIVAVTAQLGTDGARGREELDENASHEFVRGDSNQDGVADISDTIFTLGYLFRGTEEPECLAAADANDDAVVDLSDPIYLLNHLFRGLAPPPPPFPEAALDPTPDLGCREPALPPLPAVGSYGGPDRELSEAEALLWRRGFLLFDRPTGVGGGLGAIFNGDSCRACHLDPVVGGAGGLDVDVVRFARVDAQGVVFQLEGGPAASRQSIDDVPREELHPDANVVETRQTPTVLGLGLAERVPDAAILANADPADADGDGISGRARMVAVGAAGERVGRFGHKAGVPTLRDFAADALLNELGVTVDPANSPFAGAADDDGVPDPEFSNEDFEALSFFLAHLAPPPRALPEDPVLRKRVDKGEENFIAIGCARCHVPELAGTDGPVPLYSDFLLHDVADPGRRQVDEPGVEPREFRTAPLRGLRDTAPYLHDGSAETIADAITRGHHGEAEAARERFQALSFDERSKVVEFLRSL
jgi:CxxC motif-containing protein (DUF1111 family)